MKTKIKELIYTAVFNSDKDTQLQQFQEIHKIAKENGVYLASINDLYKQFGEGKISRFTVPAINVRTISFDFARTIFEIMIEKNIGPIIFEIAKSEIEYTAQEPIELSSAILAGAVAAGYTGPVYIQGDHYQFSAKKFFENNENEKEKIKKLIKKSIDAGFYNIDIDASTLVELEKTDLNEQQKNNYEMTAEMTKYIREIQPEGIEISIGGEIGHIGGRNSTVEDFIAFMEGYKNIIGDLVGISKVSVQTGTSHGGTALADGRLADVKLDFKVLEDIGKIAREKYQVGGAVQHGASTLPDDLFGEFIKYGTLEIHLATGFQNIIYDTLNEDLKLKIYNWLKENCVKEMKEGETETQFIYKTRKKGFGPFKSEMWNMEHENKAKILLALRDKFLFLFEKLNIFNTTS
jgi:fructose/tagatose bisphosphate aldolase